MEALDPIRYRVFLVLFGPVARHTLCSKVGMHKTREVAQYWSWLPAFRAVAETQHLPTAAKALCLSPSAVSRTIKLLEEQLGQTLFDRGQGRLSLNANGEVLLACVRASMRLVHEGTEVIRDAQLRGTLRIAASAGLSSVFLLPIFPRLLEEHPGLQPSIESIPPNEVGDALRRGSIDLALVENSEADEGILHRPLVRLDYDVFVAPGTDVVDLASFPFIAPRRSIGDGWPESRPRKIALRVDSASTAIDAVRGGLGAVVLPVCVGDAAGLQRLHDDGLRPSDLVLVTRSALPGTQTRADVVARLVQGHARSLEANGGVRQVLWNETEETRVA